MPDKTQINHSALRLVKGDYTDMEIEAIVYYARNDLTLGSGFGTAISVRGGPTVQEELKQFGTVPTTEAVISSAGNMKSTYIIHVVGPKFKEENLEDKLKKTMKNTLKLADEKGIKRIAFPPMGTGFYGIPLQTSARIMIDTIVDHLSGDTKIEEVVISLLDDREYKPFKEQLSALEKV